MNFLDFYYTIKPLIPRRIQIAIRRQVVRRQRVKYRDIWPIDPAAGNTPPGWPGWPKGKKFALVLTHDVESALGLEKVLPLARLEQSLGFRSSFNFVGQDYPVYDQIRKALIDMGFEVGLHGLTHKGNMFRSKRIFEKQRPQINRILKEWNAFGFRTPSMYHHLEWTAELDIEYDMSTFDTDPFEPQPDSGGTIFPYWVNRRSGGGFVELPCTMPQDHTLLIIMGEKEPGIWQRKLDWIASKGGMVLLVVHPDYMVLDSQAPTFYEYPVRLYEDLLNYVKTTYDGEYWQPLPRELSQYYKQTLLNQPNELSLLGPRSSLLAPTIPQPETRITQSTQSSQVTHKPRKPLRVCMLAYSFYDTDARVRRYAETLAQRGDYVDVIALRNEGKNSHDTLNGVNIYRIQERLLDEKGKLDYLFKIIKFLVISGYHLTRKHLQTSYDIIHVNSVPDFEVFAAIIPKILGAKIILDIHDPVPDFFAAKFGIEGNNRYIRILASIEFISAKFSDLVITVTDFWKDKIARRSNIPDNKISVILNFPDLKIFNNRDFVKEPKSDNSFTLLYPGTLNKHCGLDIAIQAVNLVKNEIRSLKFLIYGRGTELSRLKQMVNDLGLQDIIYFHTPVPLDSIPKIIGNADIGIALLSGYDDYSQQALNVKLFEFLSMGLPAIATRTKSIEYYLNEQTVMLSKPNDPVDVARCIRELYADSAKREELRENGLKFIEKNNSDVQMSNYLEIINGLEH
jgi:glycosyltransferase involved in cell wall biosynthesis